MASPYPSSSSAVAALPPRSSSFKPPAAPLNAPQGTFLPSTKVQVGSHRVIIEKYLSEGGFAHVYVVRVPRDNHKHEIAVLKRVAVPDKEHLANMRTEVETMKKLKGHKHVVTYMDSHASQLKGGGYEVFLLMEYCSGGGLIDFMNTRLQHRLTEPEILKIFGDVAEGVACMHYLKPPLLHRDLKVENVLISKTSSGSPMYKLCDFGSTAPPRPAAKTPEEGRLIEEDVQKHTTMQYRSPEMIDVWRKQPIDEKADIWALGVFLYKLCYYTTPFEAVGQMAILNASFKYPSYPSFSPRLKKLVGSMMKESPSQRPNIYQVIKEVCSMRNVEVPISDIYAQRTQSQARRNESLPAEEASPPVGLRKQAPTVQVENVPDIAPMRRGRPTAPAQSTPVAVAKPTPSLARGDPFAALDSKNYDVRVGAVDELSKRFPSLDDFTITHDKVESFSTKTAAELPKQKLDGSVTNALADQVFQKPKPRAFAEMPKAQTASRSLQSQDSPPESTLSVKDRIKEVTKHSPLVHQPTPVRPGVTYTSTGTNPSPPPTEVTKQLPSINSRPIWRLPSHHRSSSQPRASETAHAAAASLQPSLPPTHRQGLLDIHRSKSQTAKDTASSSSRPSLEGHRPLNENLGDTSISRAKSAQMRTRPSSAYVSSNLDYLREQEASRKRPQMQSRQSNGRRSQDRRKSSIDDDLELLKKAEEQNELPPRKSSGHTKRSSLSGAKNKLAGRFGDALKLFERSGGNESAIDDNDLIGDHDRAALGDDESALLSPIAGSKNTPSRYSDMEETEDLPPDVRRELERQRLLHEEKRVEAAAAEYRARVADQGTGNVVSTTPTKASTIQRRVQSLLDEASQNEGSLKVTRTAERYTNTAETATRSEPRTAKAAPPLSAKKPADLNSYNQARTQERPESPTVAGPVPPASAPPARSVSSQARVVSRPSVPPKSQALRTGGAMNKTALTSQASHSELESRTLPSSSKTSGGLAALLAKDLQGVPDYPTTSSSNASNDTAPAWDGRANESIGDDAELEFSKRYPSLNGIEMVETEIGGQRRVVKVREV